MSRAAIRGRLSRLAVAWVVVLAGCSPATTSTPSPSSAADAGTLAPATPEATAEPSPPVAPTPAGDLVAADLDGVLVSPDLAHREPIAVSIDDARVARPQSGFNAASIVWHAPVDGYETRYLLVFQEGDAGAVGPVRSARMYLAHWAAELRAAFGHYGGDRATRAWLKTYTRNLLWSVDGIGAGNPAYHRISERQAPHNAYSSTAALRRQAGKLGAPTTYGTALHVRPFRDDAPVADRGTGQTISIPFHTVTVGYTYDREANDYGRSLDGKPQLDAADGQSVTARTVVVMFVKFRLDSKIEPGHARPVLTDVGSGTALVFSEGHSLTAMWSKAGAGEPTRFLDASGAEIAFVRGRIFIEVVPLGTAVKH